MDLQLLESSLTIANGFDSFHVSEDDLALVHAFQPYALAGRLGSSTLRGPGYDSDEGDAYANQSRNDPILSSQGSSNSL